MTNTGGFRSGVEAMSIVLALLLAWNGVVIDDDDFACFKLGGKEVGDDDM
jgi:hypothetical protein